MRHQGRGVGPRRELKRQPLFDPVQDRRGPCTGAQRVAWHERLR